MSAPTTTERGVYVPPVCAWCSRLCALLPAPAVSVYVLLLRVGVGVSCCPACYAGWRGEGVNATLRDPARRWWCHVCGDMTVRMREMRLSAPAFGFAEAVYICDRPACYKHALRNGYYLKRWRSADVVMDVLTRGENRP